MTDNQQSGFVPISIPVSLRTGGLRSTTPGLKTISSCREHHPELLVLRAGSGTPRSTLQTAICTHESRRDPRRLHRLHGVPGTAASQAHRARVSQISKQQGSAKHFPGALSRRYLGACLRRPGTSKIYHGPISKSRQIRLEQLVDSWSAQPGVLHQQRR